MATPPPVLRISLAARLRENATAPGVPTTHNLRRAQQTQVLLTVLAVILPTLHSLAPLGLAEELKVNDGWRFHLDPESKGVSSGWAGPELDDMAWPLLQAGKSWTAQGYFNYSGTAWYRKRIDIPAEFQGKFLVFYGANDHSTVFLDGVKTAEHGPAADPKMRGFYTSTPPFRVRLPEKSSVLVAIRIEGMDTHRIYAPGPGLAGDVALSTSVLVRFRGYWLAPDEFVTRDEWLAEMAKTRATRREELHHDGRIYKGPYSWSAGNFIHAFVYVYDTNFYDHAKGRYRVDEYLDDGVRRFGGYDSILLWHSYTNIGVDDQNQFDMLRNMPGGIEGLKAVVERARERGVRVFIAFNPWDKATRPEGREPQETLADILSQTGADGIFLDTTDNIEPQDRLRRAVDRIRPGTVFDTEGCPGDEGIETVNGCWGQDFPSASYYDHARGVPVVKWTEPRVMIHYDGDRWRHDRDVMLQHAFLNGTGLLIWEDIFGSWNRYSERQQAAIRRFTPILRYGRDLLASDAWQPFYPTLLQDVDAHRWPGKNTVMWTIVNWSSGVKKGPVLRAEHHPGTRYFDLWHGKEISPDIRGAEAVLSLSEIEAYGFGAILALHGEPEANLKELLTKERQLSATRLADFGNEFSPPAAPTIRFVNRTTRVPSSPNPEGMVLVPAKDNFLMRISHNLGEGACYPDDDGADWSRREHFMYEANDHARNVHHKIRVPHIPAFFVDKFPVTKGNFEKFLSETRYSPHDRTNFLKDWDWTDPAHPKPPAGKLNHPVVWVALDDARAYAKWAESRLPTEEEWQYAAGGGEYLRYPWGNTWAPDKSNDNSADTTPVDAFPEGASPFGLLDMSGNVWEWTESERDDGNRYALLRGGSHYQVTGSGWYLDRYLSQQLSLGERSARPVNYHVKLFLMAPGMDRKGTIGFRCVKDITVRENR